jgi:pimeloyl-ACP methyl ester carboxylesterase
MSITKHFVTIGERQQFYRHAGSGPPVVLLHQSPRNSSEHLPLIEMLAPHFSVFSPDTPGFGLSEPLPLTTLEPIDVFAHAVADFMDAVGIERAAVYGFHTGASIGTRLARLRPDKVSLLIANGTLVLDPADRADFLEHYLPPLLPQWDGGHFVWTWQRIRDQTIFFPWYRRTRAARLPRPGPTAEEVHVGVFDMLAAGDAYRFGYHGAIAYDNLADIPHIQTKAFYLGADNDPLTAGFSAFPKLPPRAQIVHARSFPDAWESARDILVREHSGVPAPAPQPPKPRRQGLTSRFVATSAGAVRVRFNLEGKGRPVVVVHDLASSSAGLARPLTSFIGRRPVIALDLPGHGDSDPLGAGLAEAAAAVSSVAAAFELEAFDTAGIGWGGAVALTACRNGRKPSHVHVLRPRTPTDPAAVAAHWAPDLTPDPDGAHWLRAWRFARDRRLFHPWYAPDLANLIDAEPRLDLAELHQDAIDAMKSAAATRNLLPALAGFDWAAAIGAAGVPTSVLPFSWGPDLERVRAWAEAAGARIATLPDDPAEWAGAVSD